MQVSDFNYHLPPELIAQHPAEQRDKSRLMVLDRERRQTSDRFFYELPSLLKTGDLLVFNDTRVIPARLFATKDSDSGLKIEVLLLRAYPGNEWECLVRPGKKVKLGTALYFSQGVIGHVSGDTTDGGRLIRFPERMDFRAWLLQNGETPLPPYITEKLNDQERYQTIYAKYEGSVAAPTAELHFTKELLGELEQKGVHSGFLTLHVGVGTFRPVHTEQVEDHLMHSEQYILTPELVSQVRETKKAGGRVIAVGTTSVRVLESQTDADGVLSPGAGETSIFIYPGYQFKVVDGIITNFRLPCSTLLMLIAAFAGREFVLKAYQHAIDEQYRFFSFGDATIII